MIAKGAFLGQVILISQNYFHDCLIEFVVIKFVILYRFAQNLGIFNLGRDGKLIAQMLKFNNQRKAQI